MFPVTVDGQVPADGFAVGGVVGPTGQLDQPTPLEPWTVAGLRIPEIRTSLIGLPGRNLLVVTQVARPVSDLGYTSIGSVLTSKPWTFSGITPGGIRLSSSASVASPSATLPAGWTSMARLWNAAIALRVLGPK